MIIAIIFFSRCIFTCNQMQFYSNDDDIKCVCVLVFASSPCDGTQRRKRAFTKKSLGKRFCASPSMNVRRGRRSCGKRRGWQIQKCREGLVTFVRPICPHRSAARKRERRKHGKKGSRIYVRKERSKTAKVQWHLRYPVRVSDCRRAPVAVHFFAGEFIQLFISLVQQRHNYDMIPYIKSN